MPRFVDRVPTEPAWIALHRVADAKVDEVRDIYLAIVRRMQDRLDLETIAAHFAEGRVGSAINSSAWLEDLGALDPPLREVLIEGGEIAAEQLNAGIFNKQGRGPRGSTGPASVIPFQKADDDIFDQAAEVAAESEAAAAARAAGGGAAGTGGVVGISITFDKTNPVIESVIRRHLIELKGGVGVGTADAVREIILATFKQEMTPREAAKMIRSSVGLNTRQAKALVRFREQLLARNERALARGLAAPFSEARIATLVAREAAKKLRFRAMMIARQETLLMANKGQEELWRQARDKGFLKPDQKRIWIDVGDERECPICLDVASGESAIVGLFEPWETLVGPVMTPQEAHVMCRCAEGLV